MSRPATIALAAGLLLAGSANGAELDQHGQEHAWSGASGHYTVIDFAASWCAPCWRTLPKLVELAARHPELRVLVVSVDDEEAGRDRLVRELGLELPVLWDEDYAIAETYRPEAMPSTVVLDPAGEEIYRYSGSDDGDRLAFEAFVEKLPLGVEETIGGAVPGGAPTPTGRRDK